jgi:hypothetical protein
MQVRDAIGKVVTPVDFTEYLLFHNRKFFLEDFQPKPFSYAVRRPTHAIEGTISIEHDELSVIHTFCSSTGHGQPMHATINASTSIRFGGERFVHGWVTQQFADSGSNSLRLVARARQFSSYVLLLGKILSADTFDPKYAIVLSNQDIVSIPLLLETIPAPKEFKKAVESISPEMQKFAQA